MLGFFFLSLPFSLLFLFLLFLFLLLLSINPNAHPLSYSLFFSFYPLTFILFILSFPPFVSLIVPIGFFVPPVPNLQLKTPPLLFFSLQPPCPFFVCPCSLFPVQLSSSSLLPLLLLTSLPFKHVAHCNCIP
ncbi:hypothetical protein F5H01DRAFT_148716 [Linnemannia elongata]|nr:hypothetical protein F5H01DRAFT_148716 [Linnemannia elongata]